MPIAYLVNQELRLVISIHTGSIDGQEMISAYLEFLEDPAIEPDFTFLVDLSESQSGSRTPEAIRYLAKKGEGWRERSPAGSKVAVIAPTDLSYGLSRMFKAYADESDADYRLFRAAEEAMDWIGVPVSVLEDARRSLSQ